MTFSEKSRSFLPISLFLFLLASAVVSGCSSGTPTGNLVDANGNHPAGFVSTHPASARPDGSACSPCHGSDLRGGISNVSCFSASRNGATCHANGPAFHPADWVDVKTRGTSSWHGDAYLSNVVINGLPCSSCHTLGTSGTPGAGKCETCHFSFASKPVSRIPVGDNTEHDWTNFQTAGHGKAAYADDNVVNAVCQACHNVNIRFGNPPQQCHNCHEPFPSFHPSGWSSAADHGASAKGAPGTNTGFAFCRTCHGTDFAGSGSAPSCIDNASCHGTSGNPATPAALNQAPHPKRQWRISAGTSLTHTSTASDNSNATVCYACHADRANTIDVPAPSPAFDQASPPDCFNGSLCHGSTSTHPTGTAWLPGSLHGATAKADLTVCQACHADAPAPATNPRFNVLANASSANSGCENCHKARTAHPPVDPAKATGDPHWYFHRLSGNKHVACPQCHGATLQGAAEGAVGTRCQNCHVLGPPIVFPATATQPATCTTCHLFPPNGVPNQFPNIAGTHTVHNALDGVHDVCGSCHSGAGFGSGANHFMDNVVNVAFLANYNDKGVNAAYTAASGGSNTNGGTCANVNCHGAQTTPNWRTASGIDVDTQCASCHRSSSSAGTRARYNDYTNSVMRHTNVPEHAAAACTVCHDTALLTQSLHFGKLDNTAAWMKAGAQTIKSSLGYPGGGNKCTNTPSGCH